MIRVIPFEKEHLNQIKPRWCYDGDSVLSERTLEVHENSRTFIQTLESDDGIVAIVGLTVIWDGVALVWAIVSDLVMKYPKATTKKIKTLLEFGARMLKLRRVQLDVRVDFKESLRWVKFFGFKKEAVLEKYACDGTDHILFVRFF